MQKHNTPGKLIILCGLDDIGKTTLITNLSNIPKYGVDF